MRAHYERSDGAGDGAAPLFPSSTARDGRIRPNSARTGAGQGRGSSRRMAHCAQCGFVFDSNKVDVSGGRLIGDAAEPLGGLGAVTTRQTSYTIGGVSFTDTYADVVTVESGAGCPCCGSKNGAA